MKLPIKHMSTMLVLMITGTCLTAQVTINQNDMPSTGDTVRKSLALNFENYDFESAGPDFTWDYSGLIAVSQTVDTFLSVWQTPVLYWPSFGLYANLATPELGDLPFPQIPLTDVYSFFNNTSSGFYDVGFAATLYGLPLPFKYDNPDRLYAFPMNYGDVDSSLSGFQFGITDVGYIMVKIKRVNTVDGWGTLITPFGTFDVLRQKSVVDEYDSIYLDSLNAGVPVSRHYIEYKWIAKNGKEPLLQVNDNLMDFVVYYVDSLRSVTTGVTDEAESMIQDARVFPNPAQNQVTLSFYVHSPGDISIELFNMSGNKILTLKRQYLNKGKATFKFNLENFNLSSSQYLLGITTEQGRLIIKIIYKP